MTGTGLIEDVMKLRRRRVVAEVLGHCERAPWWHKLAKDEQVSLRDALLLSVNSYHDVCLDLMRAATDDKTMISDHAVRMISDLHGRAAG